MERHGKARDGIERHEKARNISYSREVSVSYFCAHNDNADNYNDYNNSPIISLKKKAESDGAKQVPGASHRTFLFYAKN